MYLKAKGQQNIATNLISPLTEIPTLQKGNTKRLALRNTYQKSLSNIDTSTQYQFSFTLEVHY